MRFIPIVLFISIMLFTSCKKVETISFNEVLTKSIEGKWISVNLLKDDELLELDDKISFVITFSNIQENYGDYNIISTTPFYTGQEVEYVEETFDSEFTIKNEGSILSVSNSHDYEISFRDEYLVLFVKDSNNKTKIVFRKI